MKICFFFIYLLTLFKVIYPNDSLFNFYTEKNYDKNKFLILKIRPLSFIHGNIPFTSEIGLMVEKIENIKISSQFGVFYVTCSPILLYLLKLNKEPKNFTIQGLRIIFDFKFYPFTNFNVYEYLMTGFYLSSTISYSTAKFYNYQIIVLNYLKAHYFHIGIKCGYQFVFLKSIILDFYAGLGYKVNNWFIYEKYNLKVLDKFYKIPIKPILGFAIGTWF